MGGTIALLPIGCQGVDAEDADLSGEEPLHGIFTQVRGIRVFRIAPVLALPSAVLRTAPDVDNHAVAFMNRLAGLPKGPVEVVGGDRRTAGLCSKVEHNCLSDELFERDLVDGPPPLGVVVARRVDVGTQVILQYAGIAHGLKILEYPDVVIENARDWASEYLLHSIVDFMA